MSASGVVRVPLHGKYGEGKFALIDAADAEKVLARRWRVSRESNGVGVSVVSGHTSALKLHRLLMPEADQIDHVNGDTFDNRRENLRAADYSQNRRNTRKRANLSSRYKGVTRSGMRWKCSVSNVYLGTFEDEIEAAKTYDAYAREHFGEFACLNFPRPGEQGALEPQP
jgi:hypothetical protein